MSAVSEAVAGRMTLGDMAERYGFELDPPFASGVTVTSIADDIDSVRPGCLYVPAQSVDVKRIAEAQTRGAYAALVPPSLRLPGDRTELPLCRARLTPLQLGRLASDLAGTPSNSLAVFVVSADDADRVEPYVDYVAEFLHMLGNPVGVITSAGSKSLERELDLHYPLSILDVQQTLSVCVEDGAAAVVIALDDRTLQPDALTCVNVDVIGVERIHILPDDRRSLTEQLASHYGFIVDDQTHIAASDEESDLLAAGAPFAHDRESIRELSLAIAMVMAAGVRKSNIRSALRVSHELAHREPSYTQSHKEDQQA
ncbi:UDP-N-acetylmuramyl peptide synthase [Bifidobacterium goeldii]|uniref:UDP-N-acetylmuramyl peptide synthase n=1 Tax=Bifidobacterium goeldii TaxID=2306975 RepID=A0A430FN64_9BIFI|nr:UDP-N-acetylmuramyl peptide synthase [Bifidobacterium goeldii]RSX54261.1 UDP-N-acetylmuramyl peptide synthase [Bifidobacterium goeldii]